MPKRKAARKDGLTSKPKHLRKRLRKTEARLVMAGAKRDKAQARVEALAIITDEIRAQLAEAERATADAEAATAAGSASSTRKTPATSSAKTSTRQGRKTSAS